MSIRPISTFVRREFHSQLRPQTHVIQRRQIPPPTQQRHFRSFIRRTLEIITGLRQLNHQEKKEAIAYHQKLWVANYAIHNHPKAHEHYEMFYSLQLLDNPKDFETQRHFTELVDKRKEELSLQELEKIIDLFQFAVAAETDAISSICLFQKLEEYETLLAKRIDES